jgi:hypothetical protein
MTMSTNPEHPRYGAADDLTPIDELVEQTPGAHPIRDVHELAAEGIFESDEEVDEFIAAVRQWRQSSVA